MVAVSVAMLLPVGSRGSCSAQEEAPQGQVSQLGDSQDDTVKVSQAHGAADAGDRADSAQGKLVDYVAGGRGRRGVWIQRDVVIRSEKDYDLKVDVYRVDDDQLRPAVLLIHGGAWAVGDKWDLEPLARSLVQAGIHAVSTNYRLAPTYKFPAQFVDCQTALAWMRHNSAALHIDESRLGVWGYSAGAQLAALTAQSDIRNQLAKTDRFGQSETNQVAELASPNATAAGVKACVCGGLPSTLDYVGATSSVFVYVMGSTLADAPDLYRSAAPLEQLQETMCPTFLYHGTKDQLVPFILGSRMHQRLQELGVNAKLRKIEGKGHIGAFLDGQTRREVIRFLTEQLVKPEKAADAIP